MFKSYSQNFEDVYINRLFCDKEKGFYIDVGAHHPEFDSVTKSFYDRGWNGINIEPSKRTFQELYESRKRDINLNIAISNHNGFSEFYDVHETGLSTLDSNLYEEYVDEGEFELSKYFVEVRTLSSVIKEHAKGKKIDFLKIDVENSEKFVLEGANLSYFKPTLIIIESTYPRSTRSIESNFSSLITESGYKKVFFDGLNSYYLFKKYIHLEQLFKVPINVFDDYINLNYRIKSWASKIKEDHLNSNENNKPSEVFKPNLQRVTKIKLDLEKNKNSNLVLLHENQYMNSLIEEHKIKYLNISNINTALRNDLNKLRHDYNNQINSIADKDNYILTLQNHISALFASNSWKISAPIRLLKFKSIKNKIIYFYHWLKGFIPNKQILKIYLRNLGLLNFVKRLVNKKQQTIQIKGSDKVFFPKECNDEILHIANLIVINSNYLYTEKSDHISINKDILTLEAIFKRNLL